MRRNFLLFLVIILAVVLNVILIGVLVQTSDNRGSSDVKNVFPEIAVRVISSLSNHPAAISNNISNPSLPLKNEKLVITSVQENLTASTFKVSVSNNDSSKLTINSILVNNYPAKLENQTAVMQENSTVELLFAFSEGMLFGHTYEIRILSLEGYSAVYYKTIC